MYIDIRVLFILFIMYSMFGWAIEVVNCYIRNNKWINRGFLVGPYCPIYGVGCILMTLLVLPTNDFVGTFLKCVAICSILEYFTSWIMEKLFKTRWWDYTKKKFNINGRICLETMIMFGFAGVVVIEVGSPALLFDLSYLSSLTITIIAIILFILFTTDLIVSYNIINSFRKLPKTIKKDNTEDITKMVRKTLTERSYLYNRVLVSFPDFQSITRKYDTKIQKQKEKIKKDKEKLKRICFFFIFVLV